MAKSFYLAMFICIFIAFRASDRNTSIQVKSIFRTNTDLRAEVFQQLNNINFYFDYSFQNQTLDVSFQTDFAFPFELNIYTFQGFIVTRNVSPFLMPPVIPKGPYSAILYLKGSVLSFYEKNCRPLDGSCDSFLTSYFDLDLVEIRSCEWSREQDQSV